MRVQQRSPHHTNRYAYSALAGLQSSDRHLRLPAQLDALRSSVPPKGPVSGEPRLVSGRKFELYKSPVSTFGCYGCLLRAQRLRRPAVGKYPEGAIPL